MKLTWISAVLHRSHSEQAVMYHDKKAALGVINNLVRAATDLPQKHDLLQSIARGYLYCRMYP